MRNTNRYENWEGAPNVETMHAKSVPFAISKVWSQYAARFLHLRVIEMKVPIRSCIVLLCCILRQQGSWTTWNKVLTITQSNRMRGVVQCWHQLTMFSKGFMPHVIWSTWQVMSKHIWLATVPRIQQIQMGHEPKEPSNSRITQFNITPIDQHSGLEVFLPHKYQQLLATHGNEGTVSCRKLFVCISRHQCN